MECMKSTNDLHTTQQCLMLLSKGAQLFPVRILLRNRLYFLISKLGLHRSLCRIVAHRLRVKY